MRDSETLLTTREVADALGVTPQTVAKWVFAGRLTPALRGPGLRGSMFFDPSDIDALRPANRLLLEPPAASLRPGGVPSSWPDG